MNRNSKKGFTIVELIIVIAVIAVLAAVLIPTFSNLIQKANEAKDTALVSNLNKAVAMDTTSHDTMYDVLKVAEDVAGINVAKINAAANSNEILWDSVNKCFVYRVGEEIKYIPDTKTKDVAGNYDYWKISSNQEDIKEGKYSIYWNGENLTDTVTVKTGFDAGTAEVANIKYTGVESPKVANPSVTIRTNGGALAINAPQDTVAHYGKASGVQITAVYGNSYHEHGEVVGNIELANGRVVMESGSSAAAIKITAEESAITAGTVTVAVDTTASNVAVVVPATVKEAIEKKEGNSINASADNVITDNTVIENMKKFAGGIGTENSPYLVSSVTEWMNVKGVSTQGKSFKVVCDLDFSGSTDISIEEFSGIMDFGNHTVKGVNESNTYQNYGYLFVTVGSTTQSTQIRNANFIINGYSSLVFNVECAKEFVMENVTVNGSAEITGDNNYSPFISRITSYSNAICNVVMKNCINNANITSDACTGVFVGKLSIENKGVESAKIEFNRCINNGTVSRTTGIAAMLFANACTFANQKIEDITIIDCVNNGRILGTSGARFVAADYSQGYGWNAEKENEFRANIGSNFINGSVDGLGTIKTDKLTVENGLFVLPTVEGAARYTFSFGIWNTSYYKNGEKCSWGQSAITFAIDASQVSTAKIKAMKFIQYDYSKDSKQTISTESAFGTEYNTCGNNYVYKIDLELYGGADYAEIKLQPTVSYIAYSEAGVPLAVYSFDLNSLA